MAIRMIRGRRGLLTMSALAVAILTVVPVSVAMTSAADTIADVPGDPITVDVVSINGSGCPAGSAAVRPLADNTGFSVAYSSYAAQANGAAAPTEFRENCQLALNVHVPQGFSFAVAQAEYSGTAQLAPGTTGLERANYYFQGSSDNNYSDHRFTGPLYGRWKVSDTAAALIYSPCASDQILNVNTELRVDDGVSTSASSLRMTASSGDVNTIYHFSWRRC
jgi:hypothetical protein